MQGMKALVIFLGVLIVLGLGVLVYGIATKAGKLGETAETFADSRVALPEGAEVVEMRPDGDRLYLRLDGPGGPRILVLDDAGRRLGEIALDGARGGGAAAGAAESAEPAQ